MSRSVCLSDKHTHDVAISAYVDLKKVYDITKQGRISQQRHLLILITPENIIISAYWYNTDQKFI